MNYLCNRYFAWCLVCSKYATNVNSYGEKADRIGWVCVSPGTPTPFGFLFLISPKSCLTFLSFLKKKFSSFYFILFWPSCPACRNLVP